MIKYFESVANNYTFKSNSFPWSIIRKIESSNLLSLIHKNTNSKILDLGSGTGYYSELFIKLNDNKVFAVDSSPKMLKNIKNNQIKKFLGDAKKINLNMTFDIIVCAGIIEFIGPIDQLLLNVKKHSNTNTNFLILLPRKNILGKIYQFFHKRNDVKIKLYNISEIDKELNHSDWKIIKFKKVFPFSYAILCKLNKNI